MPSFAIDTSDDVDDVAPDADDAEASEVFPMAWFHEALWVIYNIAAVAALLVTLTFWSLLFRLVSNLRALTVVVHGMNSVLMISDTVLSSIPVRLFHLFSICYESGYKLSVENRMTMPYRHEPVLLLLMLPI